MNQNETGQTPRDAGSAQLAADRRRPGRPSEVNPELIPILRGEFEAPLPPEPTEASARRELLRGAAAAAILFTLGMFLRLAI